MAIGVFGVPCESAHFRRQADFCTFLRSDFRSCKYLISPIVAAIPR